MNTVRAKAVSQQLDIAPTTLRLWSRTFEEFLSASAQSSISERGTPTQRRYTPEDVEILTRVKFSLGMGLTYEEIKDILRKNPNGSLMETVILPVVNGHVAPADESAVALPTNPDLTELTTLLARSVALQEETVTLLRQLAEKPPAEPEPSFFDRLRSLLKAS